MKNLIFLNDNMLNIFNQHAPIKQLSNKETKNLLKPWISKGILASIKIKNLYYSKYMKCLDPFWYVKYKTYRDKINHLIRISKNIYYKNYFKRFNTNLKKTWSGIKTFLSNHKTAQTSINLQSNGEIITDQKRVADKFNDFFINIGPDLSKQIPKSDIDFNEFLKNPSDTNMFLSPTDSIEIESLIQNLDESKSTDIYDTSIKLLKMASSFLSDPISDIINHSFITGIFPDKLKCAYVLPAHKANSKLSVGNYRPISILPIISKIFEKVVSIRLINFLKTNNVIFKHQFGFQSGMSTDLAILDVHSKIIEAFENKKFACCVFLDFAKAFDTVNHKILLKKLEYYGVRGIVLKWFDSYLCNRPQCVNINGTFSDFLNILCGVPQGSILGPILFLIYINDIQFCSNILDFHLFADDTSLFFSHKDENVIENTVNNELTKVEHWLQANKLTLNVSKSNYIIFKPSQRNVKKVITLKINNTAIEAKAFTKYLGVILDDKLSWKQHCDYLIPKLQKGIGVLSKLRYYLDKNAIRNVYFALFESHLNYNILNWSCAPQRVLDSVSYYQRKALRMMSYKDDYYPCDPLFKDFDILNVEKCIKLSLSKISWKLKNKVLPSVITDIFMAQRSSVLPNRYREYGYNFVPKFRTLIKERFVSNKAPLLWSNIPTKIKAMKSLKSFTKHFKSILQS